MTKPHAAHRRVARRDRAVEVPAPAPEKGSDKGAERGGERRTGFAGYGAALKWLNDRVNLETIRQTRVDREAFKLDRMTALLELLDNPHRQLRCVHVAGSKGKGSVCEMTASCLSACGYATGLYTSPHLVDVRERVRLGGRMITPEAFTEQMSRVARATRKLGKDLGEVSFFEAITALAFAYDAEQAVDVVVVEVGLGGRLDATNVITPEVCAITAIQLEHTAILGHTLAEIAREKAGIMKPGVPCLTIPQPAPVIEAFRESAARAGAPLEVLGEGIEFSCRFESTPELGPHARVCINTPRSAFEHLPVPLKGEHQAANCGLALAIVDRLRQRGFDTPERKVAEGLAATPSHGRMEMVSRSPRVMIDGAHNPESIQCLVKAIGAHVRYDSMVVVFGCAADKDVKGMLQRIALGADKIVFTRSTNPRAMDPRELQKRFAEVSSKMTQVARTLPDALAIAARAVGRDDLICVTGSFHLAGEARRHYAPRAV